MPSAGSIESRKVAIQRDGQAGIGMGSDCSSAVSPRRVQISVGDGQESSNHVISSHGDHDAVDRWHHEPVTTHETLDL